MAEFNYSVVEELNSLKIGDNLHVKEFDNLTLASLACAYDKKLAQVSGAYNKDLFQEKWEKRIKILSKISKNGDLTLLADYINQEIYDILTDDIPTNEKIAQMHELVVSKRLENQNMLRANFTGERVRLEDFAPDYTSAVGTIKTVNEILEDKEKLIGLVKMKNQQGRRN